MHQEIGTSVGWVFSNGDVIPRLNGKEELKMYILCFKKSMNEAKPISFGFFSASPLSAFHNICLDRFRRIDQFTNFLNECRDLVKVRPVQTACWTWFGTSVASLNFRSLIKMFLSLDLTQSKLKIRTMYIFS